MWLRTLIFFALLTALASTCFAQAKVKVKRKGSKPHIMKITAVTSPVFSLQQLSGKWQEIVRTDRNNNAVVSFQDTMYLFFSGDNVYTKDGVHMSLRGKALVENGNSLVAAADVYTIKSINNNEAVLDDGDKFIHRLISKKSFWYETLPNTAIGIEKYETPMALNLKFISGKWQVYKRDARPGLLPTDDYLIKEINTNVVMTEQNGTGEITFYLRGKLETLPCNITVEGNKIQIISENHTWKMNNYKADGTEFIFGDAELKYFSKPLL